MNIKMYSFPFDELTINMEYIAHLIGNYTNETLPDPYPEMISNELTVLHSYTNIQGGYRIIDNPVINNEENTVSFDNLVFNSGKQVIRHLKKSEKLAVYICTAGSGISERSKKLMSEGLLLEGYITDLLGSIIVETAMDKIYVKLREEMEYNGLSVSNRYSPGYCNWDVAEQQKLFSLFPTGFCGVSLSDSSLMHPIKSVSGIIGIGREVTFHKYVCNACSDIHCIYRNMKYL